MLRAPRILALALTVVLAAACGGGPDSEAPAQTDVQMASQTEAQPAVNLDTPPETKPAATPQPAPAKKPAPKPAARTEPKPEPKVEPPPEPRIIALTVPSATQLRVTLDQELSTKATQVGDVFTATVAAPVLAGDYVAVPIGSRVHGVVTAVQEAKGESPAVLKVDFTQIDVQGQAFPLRASVAEANPEKKSSISAGDAVVKVGGGAAAGAILGRIIGKDAKGTLIGAAVGAAAGTAIMLGTQDSYGVLAKDSEMGLRLEEPLEVLIREEIT
ncbi:MAG TPA: glycine zipper domain-containing protein [Pseudomonadales bacterium]